ncbi:hypothetical protein [Polyangium spumosum]|uniref:Tetratricopeptide repeat protein n=1 Tax=Polyangium spumosum TaxID=889282 RepID=A0A6N7PUU6_9BACT|nr:hypothetical protein [Polyangium spumosum]MRG94025.1 hypothetical protein [Polyangium spumosum]
MAGWGQDEQPAPKAPAIRGEAAWELIRERLDNVIGFWVGFVFSPVPPELRTLRERIERHVTSENHVMVTFVPSTPEELLGLPTRMLEDRSLANATLIWIEALHAEAPGAPETPWTRAWEQTVIEIEALFEELRGVLLGGIVLAAPPGVVDPVSKAAPDLWQVKALSYLITPRNAASVRPSTPLPVRGSTRPSTSSMRAASVDPDDLVAISQSPERLKVWQAENSARTSSPSMPAASLAPATLATPSAPRAEVIRARALVDAAEGFLRQGRLQDAKDAADEAATLLRVRGDALDEARVFAVLAEIEAENEDLSRAAVHVQKALAMYGARMPGQVPPAWYCLAARIARERREHVAASRFEELALGAIRAMRQGDEGPDALFELSDALERIGDARLAAGKPADAAVAFSECLLLRRRVLVALGEVPEALGEVSYSLKRLADACVHASDVIGAVAAYREALVIDRKLYAQDRKNAEVRYQLADSLWRLGDALTSSGEAAEGAAMSEEATRLLAGAEPPSGTPARIYSPGSRRGQPPPRRELKSSPGRP